MNLSSLIPLAACCLAALTAAAAPAGFTLMPEECGLPPLDFDYSPNAPAPSAEFDWQRPGNPPLRARMLHMGSDGKGRPCAVLGTEGGGRHELALDEMEPGDRQRVDAWLESRGFVRLPLCMGKTIVARVLSVEESSLKRPFPFLDIQLMTPEGKTYLLCCNARPVTEAEARQNSFILASGRRSIYFTAEGLERLRGALARTEARPTPILLAAGPAEAASYAARHGLTAVTIYLNRRGGEIDLAWREYLRRHPEAGAYWNSRYVFVGVYCDAMGNYPPELLREIQAALPYGTMDSKPPAALHTGNSYHHVPDFFSIPQTTQDCNSIADFLATPPSQLRFGR